MRNSLAKRLRRIAFNISTDPNVITKKVSKTIRIPGSDEVIEKEQYFYPANSPRKIYQELKADYA